MDKKDLSVCTITWARDLNEENLLRESLKRLAAINVPVFICDGGSNNEFIHFLQGFPQFTLVQRKAAGLLWQVKASIDVAFASASPYILYTEPDKLEFFEHSLADFLDEASLNEESGIHLASRSKEAFETFPSFQTVTETAINNCCAEVIGKPFDYSYGPFILKSSLVPYLEKVKDNIGWGWRQYMFGTAKRLQYSITESVGYFPCQVQEREDDPAERLYRMRQLSQGLNGLILSTTMKNE